MTLHSLLFALALFFPQLGNIKRELLIIVAAAGGDIANDDRIVNDG